MTFHFLDCLCVHLPGSLIRDPISSKTYFLKVIHFWSHTSPIPSDFSRLCYFFPASLVPLLNFFLGVIVLFSHYFYPFTFSSCACDSHSFSFISSHCCHFFYSFIFSKSNILTWSSYDVAEKMYHCINNNILVH